MILSKTSTMINFIPQIKSMGEVYCKFWLRKKEEDSEDFEFKCWVNKNWENLTD